VQASGSSLPLVGAILVLGLSLLLFLASAALILFQKGRRRAALVAPLVPLVALPAVLAVALGSFRLTRAFAYMAATGGVLAVVPVLHGVWLLTRCAGAALALLAGLGLVGGLIRTGAADASPACSPPRAVALLLLPAMALVLLAGLVREERTAVHVARLVIEDKSPQNETAMAAYGFGTGTGAIAAVSSRIARAAIFGSAGSILAAVVLLGLSLTGAILAWPVRVGPGFAAASALLWMALLTAGAAIAAGLYTPL
jgi:hypothetical protein